MRKLLTITVLSFAALALVATAAFACGEKKCDSVKTDCAGKVSSVHSSAASDEKGVTAEVTSVADSGNGVLCILSVKGMTGDGCEETISAELTKVKGVTQVVKVCRATGQVIVRVDANAEVDAELTKVLNSKGYKAEIIPAVARTVEGTGKGPVCPLSGGPGCTAPEDTTTEKKDKGSH